MNLFFIYTSKKETKPPPLLLEIINKLQYSQRFQNASFIQQERRHREDQPGSYACTREEKLDGLSILLGML
jgi:hypothetical protein